MKLLTKCFILSVLSIYLSGCATISNFTKPKMDYTSVKSFQAKDATSQVDLYWYFPESNNYYECTLNKYQESVKSEHVYNIVKGKLLSGIKSYEILGEFEYAIFGRDKEYLKQYDVDQLLSQVRTEGGDALLITSFRRTQLGNEGALFAEGPYTVFARVVAYK